MIITLTIMATKADMERYVEMAKELDLPKEQFWRFVVSRPAFREKNTMWGNGKGSPGT